MNNIFMLYGVSCKNVENYLSSTGVLAKLSASDNGIELVFDYGNLSDEEIYSFLHKFTLEYQNYIYAETKSTLCEQLLKIAKLRKIKIKTGESFTGGQIASQITSVSGASEVFLEGIVAYSNDAKINRLGVSEETIKNCHPVSSEVACEMCKGLIGESDNVLAISTTGIAGPNSDESGLPVGLCYIAVGSQSKIAINKHVFKGNRLEITKQGKYAALFHAVMALRCGDFDL